MVSCYLVLFVFAGCSHISPHAGQPKTIQVQVADLYHDIKVVDDYQWLENWDDPQVKTWSNAQSIYARNVLDAMPSRHAIRARVKELYNLTPVIYSSPAWREDKLFAIKFQPPLNRPLLVVMPSADEPEAERVVVDPNKLDARGSVSIDWYVPSPDGELVAVSLSTAGTLSGDVHIYETETGSDLEEIIPRVNGHTAGGDLGWTPDGMGFYYTRYPRQGDRPAEDLDFYQQLWFHSIGTQTEKDRYEFGRGFPRIAEIEVEVERDSGRVLATVQLGDSGRFAYFVRELNRRWRQIAGFDDGIVEAIFGPESSLFLVMRNDTAPRGKILHLEFTDLPLGQARKIVPEGGDTIVSEFYGAHRMVSTETRLYVTYQLGGPSEIRVFDHNGRRQPGPKIPSISAVGRNLAPLGGDDILFAGSSYIDPVTWYRFNAETGATQNTALSSEYPIDFSDTEVVREFSISNDGTKVPINIVRLKGIKLGGQNPVLLTGYGGFGKSLEPNYNPLRRIWLDLGGVFAFANLRGGGEYGEKWHKEGVLTKKQNVFDDFYACMRYMVDTAYTTPERLAIKGRSNGGLLMGAIITQHPEAARAVVSDAGIYDMLRTELSSNGKFNIPEFGTVEDLVQFKALYAYSPYHRVEKNVDFPAVLFLTNANDPIVDSMHSRKMTAGLQTANSSNNRILLSTNPDTGHGFSTSLDDQIEKQVDILSFVFHELGVMFRVQ
ncbi:MAG: S9 family peptidase [Proteobacteria bacterium]|nr:S9 family peptidase [Pseudomonadota bacterium]